MANYFEVRIKRTYVDEKNTYKTVKEAYLIDAVTYTEAEARMAKFMGQQYKGDSYTVLKIQSSKISMLYAQQVQPIDSEGTMPDMAYFKVKCVVLMEIEGRKKPKRIPVFGLVKAIDSENAVAVVDKMMDKHYDAVNFDLVKMEKTKFVGIVVASKK